MKISLSELFSEIFSDIEEGNENTRGFGRRGRGIGFLVLLVPHILGTIVGCAVARMFSLNADGYLHLSILFAFVAGVFKSCSFDRMDIVRSVLKNLLIMLLIGGIILIAYFTK